MERRHQWLILQPYILMELQQNIPSFLAWDNSIHIDMHSKLHAYGYMDQMSSDKLVENEGR